MKHSNRIGIRFLIMIPVLLGFMLLQGNPCEAKGLPKDLGMRMAKIHAGESGQAGEQKKVRENTRSRKPKIQMDAATLKLSTERIELPELLAYLQNPASSAKPDKTAKASLEQPKIAFKVEEIRAAEL